MKNNQLIDILNYWNQMNFAEKATALQKFENINAKFLDRQEREIILTSNLINTDDYRTSYFDPTNSNYIFVNDNKNANPIEIASAIYKSGLFASINDFYNNKSNIVSFEPRNKESFLKEHLVEQAVRSNSFEFEHGLSTIGQEQRYAQRESALYLVYTLLSACQTVKDCSKLYQEYGAIFDNYYEYLHEYAYQSSRQTYFQQMLNSFNKSTSPDNLTEYLASFKKEIVLPSQLNETQIKFLIDHFDKNLKLFAAFKEIQTKEGKIDNYRSFFNNFVNDSHDLGI